MNKELEAYDIVFNSFNNCTCQDGRFPVRSALDTIYQALKRNEPMKVNSISTHDGIGLQYGTCSNCGSITKRHYRKGKTISLVDGLFCSTCGQRLDWSDEK